MKTLGEILTAARLEKRLSIEDVAKITKIESRHIKSLESNNYQTLPPATFTKGFIRNYAKAVGKNPDDLVAIYRRDSKEQKVATPSAYQSFSLRKAFISVPKSTLALALFGVFVFGSYFLFQYRALIVPPPLTISQPKPQDVTTSPVTIEGKTSPDSLVTVNDIRLKPDQSGIFVTELNFSPGDHELKIVATNRYNRTSTQEFTISVISQ